jgi:GAF domain-containing protein
MNLLLIIGLLISGLVTILVFNLTSNILNRTLIWISVGVLLVALGLAYRGLFTFGKYVTPTLVVGMATYFMLDGDGVRDVTGYNFFLALIVAGILIGKNGAVAYGVSASIIVVLMGIAELNGLIETNLPLPPQPADIGLYFILLMVATGAQRFSIGQLERTLTESKEAAREQEKVNKELRALQTELEQRVKERTEQLEATNEVGRVASATLDPNQLINKVVHLITETFGYYYAAIFLVAENGLWAELKDATGTAGRILKSRRHRLQVGGNSMVGTAISNKAAHIALDVGEAPVRFNNPLLPNTRSEIALPLMIGERVIGALNVQSTKEADFKPDDISTLQNMANQVAIALENARLFGEMNETLDELMQSTRQYISSAWAEKIKSNALEIVSEQEYDEELGQTQEVAVALNLREQTIGQITLEAGEDWGIEDQAWVEAFATQVAISLENARLLEESQRAAIRERLSSSIVQKIWSANSIDVILQTTIKELGRALEASEASIELNLKD